jgi:hypothetical protein
MGSPPALGEGEGYQVFTMKKKLYVKLNKGPLTWKSVKKKI